MSYFVPSVITGMAAGGALVGAAAWNRPWYGLFSGTIHGVIAVALNHFFGLTVSAVYLAGLTIFLIGKLGTSVATTDPLDSPTLRRLYSADDRKRIAQETLKCIEDGFYLNHKGERLSLRSGETLFDLSIAYTAISKDPVQDLYESTQITVVSRDCMEVAQEEAQSGANVALVNFASPIEPGGGFEEGTNGQEEQLCYSSELAGFMKQVLIKFSTEDRRDFFPLNNHQDRQPGEPLKHEKVVYTPHVKFFRSNAAHHYAFLEKPFAVGIISSAAVSQPPLDLHSSDNPIYRDANDSDYVKEAIHSQLDTAYRAGHDTAILGAFGCGSFKNPPLAVALLYRQVIEAHFKKAFKKIIFAILDDPVKGEHNPEGNFKPFAQIFRVHRQ